MEHLVEELSVGGMTKEGNTDLRQHLYNKKYRMLMNIQCDHYVMHIWTRTSSLTMFKRASRVLSTTILPCNAVRMIPPALLEKKIRGVGGELRVNHTVMFQQWLPYLDAGK